MKFVGDILGVTTNKTLVTTISGYVQYWLWRTWHFAEKNQVIGCKQDNKS
jgi:hypothetical protein